MLDLFASAALWVVQLLIKILPDSFVPDWLSGLNFGLDAVVTGLGYLNWFVDVNGMCIVMGLWLVAISAYYTWKFGTSAFDGLRSMVGSVTGWVGSLFGGGGQ